VIRNCVHIDEMSEPQTNTAFHPYIYILEPVSVGGWNTIWLGRITRSSTCVCLRLRNFVIFFAPRHALRALSAPHTRTSRLRRPVPSLYSRARSHAPLSRGTAAPPRLRAARATRTQTPITCAHFPNEFLYQFGVQSVQTFGRQCWIVGDVRMFARAARASMRTRDRRPP
jgi:hypothetical protein